MTERSIIVVTETPVQTRVTIHVPHGSEIGELYDKIGRLKRGLKLVDTSQGVNGFTLYYED